MGLPAIDHEPMHMHSISFGIDQAFCEEAQAYARSIPAVQQVPAQRMHLTAMLINERYKGIVQAAIDASVPQRFTVELGDTGIYRGRSLVIDLADPRPVREYQQKLIDALQEAAISVVSRSYAQRFMDRLTKNRSMAAQPHITIGKVSELDIPSVPLTKAFRGRLLNVETLELNIDYDRNQRRTYQL